MWYGRFHNICSILGEDKEVMNKIKTVLTTTEEKSLKKAFKAGQALLVKLPAIPPPPTQFSTNGPSTITPLAPINPESYAPPPPDEKAAGLHRWNANSKDIQTAIADQSLHLLITLLSSPYSEVRTSALTNLSSAMTRLDAIRTTYPDAAQIYLLLGILTTTAATATPPLSVSPTPYICTSYACAALSILSDPMHPLYDTIARFHTRSPTWDISRLPSFWTHKMLLTPPASATSAGLSDPTATTTTSSTTDISATTGKSLTPELHFLLIAYLYPALRTPADLEILRARNTFEPLLALVANPFAGPAVEEAVLRLLWRASAVEGGSTMLVTRKVVVAWLAGRIACADDDEEEGSAEEAVSGSSLRLESKSGLKELVRRLWGTCDKVRVGEWSSGAMERVVMGILGERGDMLVHDGGVNGDVDVSMGGV